jgi:extracellular factor (EF) 3-hydroxypalmitic acid methyl ester biosynthesis protein
VRYRRDLLRDAIKETISKNPEARILAVACGHLRELETLEIGSAFIVALDQDGESLRVVQERFPRVVLEKLSIGAMLRGKLAHSNFDLVYAAGLFDYLEDGVARHLCTDLIGRLSENGRLLIGNYTPNNTGRGYMDAVMDWQLIYRTEAALQDLLPLQSSQVATFTDPWGNVVYADYKRS